MTYFDCQSYTSCVPCVSQSTCQWCAESATCGAKGGSCSSPYTVSERGNTLVVFMYITCVVGVTP